MRRVELIRTIGTYGVVIALAALVLFGFLRYDRFLSTFNVMSVLRYNSMFALVSLGMCFVIMTGGIDLSVGAVAAMGSVASALASPYGLAPGLAAGVFVGLAAGALSADISVPELVPTLGLILFIYTIGIQSGPAFFQSFRKHGWRDSLFVAALLIAGAALTMAVSRPLHLEGPRRAGLFAGALTNTPALAATREHIRDSGKA